jgi:transcriptional regulator with GAF, ATPase, and Fis domain
MPSPRLELLEPLSPRAGWHGPAPSIPWDLVAQQLVLLGDPHEVRGRELARALKEFGLRVDHHDNWHDLTRSCQADAPAALALALQWGPAPVGAGPGAALAADAPALQFLRAHGRQLAVLVYADTSRLPIGSYCRVLVAGAKQVLSEQSPTFLQELRQTLGRLVHEHQAQQEERHHLAELFARHGLIGRSAALQEVFRRAVQASHFSDLPLLLLGETGTGKQRLAEAIHRLDPVRSARPFLTVNCSAINKTLAESELFGHAKGAFSGAGADRLGLFRAADGGTLLLDEIGELDLELQPKLLRVLQERRLLPVGEDREHAVDVRSIAATNRPLDEMVARGQFREDLYHRLNVFSIRIPPLRERPEDIDVQAQHFLRQFQAGRPVRVTAFDPRVLEVLRVLPWEGNTRQLQNFILEALARKRAGTVLQMEDLPHWVLETLAQTLGQLSHPASGNGPGEETYPPGLSLSQVMDEFERRILHNALEKNGGNRTRTAAELGLTPRSIFNKIKKHGLDGK